jgi:hypothetical protein
VKGKRSREKQNHREQQRLQLGRRHICPTFEIWNIYLRFWITTGY